MNQPLSQTFTATWHLVLSPMHATSHVCDKTTSYHLESVTPDRESVFTTKHYILLHTKYCISLAAKNR